MSLCAFCLEGQHQGFDPDPECPCACHESSASRRQSSVSDDVQETFEDFWADIVCPSGLWDYEQIKRELHDYRMLLREVPKVYYHVSGGRISKPNTVADAVIGVHDDLWHWNEDCTDDDPGRDWCGACLCGDHHRCEGTFDSMGTHPPRRCRCITEAEDNR
jgi:hypothetical protein